MRAHLGKGKEAWTRIVVRLPVSLKRQIEEVASHQSRSLNYEIFTRLRLSGAVDRLLEAKSDADALSELQALKRRLIDGRLPTEEDE